MVYVNRRYLPLRSPKDQSIEYIWVAGEPAYLRLNVFFELLQKNPKAVFSDENLLGKGGQARVYALKNNDGSSSDLVLRVDTRYEDNLRLTADFYKSFSGVDASQADLGFVRTLAFFIFNVPLHVFSTKKFCSIMERYQFDLNMAMPVIQALYSEDSAVLSVTRNAGDFSWKAIFLKQLYGFFASAVHALSMLKKADRVHRDIKPENFGFAPAYAQTQKFLWCLSDFGGLKPAGSLASFVGSPAYLAPQKSSSHSQFELAQDDESSEETRRADFGLDTWPVGFIMLEMMRLVSATRDNPLAFTEADSKPIIQGLFVEAGLQELTMAMLITEIRDWKQALSQMISQEEKDAVILGYLKKIALLMCQYNPYKRPLAEALFEVSALLEELVSPATEAEYTLFCSAVNRMKDAQTAEKTPRNSFTLDSRSSGSSNT